MPEGPEIRRAADRVAKAVRGHAVAVEAPWEPIAAALAALDGRRVTSVDTRGKAMLTRFEGGLVLYSHNQLYGRWQVVTRGRAPRSTRSLRLALHGPRRSALLYSATDIEVIGEEAVSTHPFLAKLGPDLLDAALGVDDVVARLEVRRRRQLASLYLDQSFLAGLGNYLRAEILFVAAVDPSARPANLDPSALRRLAEVTIELPRRSLATGGITLDAHREEVLREEGASRRARRHYVYGREGRPCRLCETPIERADLGGRHLFLCPRCQRGA